VRLIEAYARARAVLGPDAWPLLLRGSRLDQDEELTRAVARHEVQDHVRFLPRLADGEMPALYTAAAAVVFPSQFEGAGLPLVEAIACGCPVLPADIPTARDLLGASGLYFDPGDVEAMAVAMVQYARTPARREADRARGLQIAAQYSDVAIADRLQACYTSAVERGTRAGSRRTA
jgi:glycosyltransferase involved in cell wall biosynthesis